MHILLIHQAFAALNEPGGTRHHEFARLLVEKGHQVTVIASPVSYLSGNSSNKKEENIDGVRILRAYTYVALHRSFVHRFFSFVSFMISSFWLGLFIPKVDIVWGTSPPIFQGVSALLLARLKGAKFLFEVRDLWPEFAVAVGVLTNPLLIKLSEWLERFLYRNSDQMIVNSPGYVDHAIARGGEPVALIPNGADVAMFADDADPMSFKEKHNLQGKFVVLYAGAHGMSNDLGVLLASAEILLEEKDIHFVFVGDGKEKQDLIRQAIEQGLTNVSFIDPVSKEKMAQVIAAADLCVGILKPIDSYKKTYPNKIFDYMAAGKPVALAIDGVIRQVVESAKCGMFCQPGQAAEIADRVRYYFAHPEIARLHGINGRNYLIQNFDRKKLADQLLDIFTILNS